MFLYVYTLEDKNKLLAAGYKLVKEDLRNNLWIFEYSPLFCLSDVSFLISDTLSF